MPKPLDLPFDPIARAAETWQARFGDSAAMAAVTAIMRVQQILLGQLDGLLRPHGLTFARYEALVLLSFSREGELPMRIIGERLMVHPTSVTNTIDRLERQQLVERKPNPRDGRGTLAAITPTGREVMRRATDDLMRAEFGMGSYSDGELRELFALLRGLRVTAGDFRDGDFKDGDVKDGDVKGGDVKGGDVKGGGVKDGDVKDRGQDAAVDPVVPG